MIVATRANPDGESIAMSTVLRGHVESGRIVIDENAVLPEGAAVRIELIPAAAMSQAEWEAFIRSTAGSIADPTFVRHPQGEYEQREVLP
jgi:antitoxin FitA